MAHPIFSNVPDSTTAEAFSEVFSPGYTYLFEGPRNTPHGAQFPLEPTYFSSIMAAYLRDDGQGLGIKRQFADLNPGSVDPEELAGLYERRIGKLQLAIPELLEAVAMMPALSGNGLEHYYIEATQKENKKLLAAHLVGRVASTDKLVDALAYPKVISIELPLQMRDLAVSVFGIGTGVRIQLEDKRLMDGDEERLGRLLRQEEVVKNIGAMAASSLLPSVSMFRASLQV